MNHPSMNNDKMNVRFESSFTFLKRAREDEDDNDTVSSTDGSFPEKEEEEDYSDSTDSSNETAFQADKRVATDGGTSPSRSISLLERLRDVASHNNLPLLTSTDLVGNETTTTVPRQRSEADLLEPARKKMIFAIQTTSAVPESVQSSSPFQCLQDMFAERGVTLTKDSYESQSDWMPWNVEGYTAELTKAIRENDVATIRRLHEKGQNLQCSNKFGESVVHTAARRGSYDVLRYLMNEADVSIKVCCDSGRNPLHDSCWTGQPQFDCVRLLLKEAPTFLFCMDKRGFTPLEYVPRDAYPLWNQFLKTNLDLLPLPR